MKKKHFSLTRGIFLRRIFITAMVVAVGIFTLATLIKNLKEDTSAITGDGGWVSVTYSPFTQDSTQYYSFGNWFTPEFSVTGASGTVVGACSMPGAHSPSGNYQAKVYNMNPDNMKKIRLAMYIYIGSSEAVQAVRGNYFYQAGKGSYAQLHALVGHYYTGRWFEGTPDDIPNNYLSDSDSSLSWLINTNSTVYQESQGYQLYGIFDSSYGASGYSDADLQNVLWIEGGPATPVTYSIDTNATEGGDKYLEVGKAVTVVDQVNFCGAANHTYTIEGKLVNKTNTNQIGNTASVSGSTDASGCGIVNLNYQVTVDGNVPAVVGFAYLKEGNTVHASHEEINDADQTITTYKVSLFTKAHNSNASGSDYTIESQSATVYDEISYCVKPNETYTLTGEVFDVTAGAVIQGSTKSQTLTVGNNNCGTTTMTFTNINAIAGHKLVVHETIKQGNTTIISHADNNDANQTIYTISLSTKAHDTNASGDEYIIGSNNGTLYDEVSYCLKPNTTYTLVGEVFDVTANNTVPNSSKTQELTVGSDACGTTTMTFAGLNVIAGHKLVAFETIKQGNTTIITHANAEDANQTTYGVSLSTTASDKRDGDKFVEAEESVTIQDIAHYCAKPGTTYTISGIVMDKTTGEPLLINGEEVKTSKEFTSGTTNCGDITIEFTFNALDIAGKDVVVFETLSYNNKTVIEHKDIDDPAQTVTIVSLHTTAFDPTDNDHYYKPEADIEIRDLVDYCVKPGEQYMLISRLIDKSTGDELVAGGESRRETVIFQANEPCGQVTVHFNINASDLAGTEILVAEDLYHDGRIIISHDDLSDMDQTVAIVTLDTDAANKATGEKTLPIDSDVEIVDKVSYCLQAGQKYTLKGTLMDKKTGNALLVNSKTVENELTFTPEENCGEIEMTFAINTKDLGGTEIVVFEGVYKEDKEVIVHHDINDAAQTVIVDLPTPDTGLITTTHEGASESSNAPLFIAVISVAVLGGYAGYRAFSRNKFLK